MELARLVEEGGLLARLVLVIGLAGGAAAVALAALSLALPRRRLAVVACGVLGGFALVAAGTGWLGWTTGLRAVRAAVASAAPEQAQRLLVMGSAEARSCLVLGFAAAILPLVGLGLTLARAVPARPSGLALAGGVALALGLAAAAGDLASRQLRIASVERLWAQASPELRAAANPRVFDLPEPYGLATYAGGAGALLGGILLGLAAARERASAPAAQGGGSWPASS